jgi:hypothetical protein
VISKTAEDHFRKEVRKLMNELADTTATGGCSTWEMYQSLTGEIKGLAEAERIFLDMVESYNKEEDE